MARPSEGTGFTRLRCFHNNCIVHEQASEIDRPGSAKCARQERFVGHQHGKGPLDPRSHEHPRSGDLRLRLRSSQSASGRDRNYRCLPYLNCCWKFNNFDRRCGKCVECSDHGFRWEFLQTSSHWRDADCESGGHYDLYGYRDRVRRECNCDSYSDCKCCF